MMNFIKSYNLLSLIRIPTYFKNPKNPSCVILTDSPFKSRCVIEIGLSKLLKITVALMMVYLLKKWSLITSKYKSFTIERYKEDLLLQLPNKDFNTNTLEKVLTTFVNFFNQYAPCKNKTWRANHSSLTNKKLCKALITRTKLKNKCLRNRRLNTGQQIII